MRTLNARREKRNYSFSASEEEESRGTRKTRGSVFCQRSTCRINKVWHVNNYGLPMQSGIDTRLQCLVTCHVNSSPHWSSVVSCDIRYFRYVRRGVEHVLYVECSLSRRGKNDVELDVCTSLTDIKTITALVRFASRLHVWLKIRYITSQAVQLFILDLW